MPYTKDKNGESIFVTKTQLKAHEDPNDPYEIGVSPCAPGNTLCKDGLCRDMRGLTPWPKGQSGNKAGKKKGTKNKKTLKKEAREKGYMTGYELLSEILNDETLNINQRMAAAKEVMKFETPALSSVEMHTDEENKSPFKIILTDTETVTPKDTKGPKKD